MLILIFSIVLWFIMKYTLVMSLFKKKVDYIEVIFFFFCFALATILLILSAKLYLV